MDLEAVKQLFNPYLEEHKLSLEEIGFVKESGYLILRLTVDRPGGIDLDTLAACNEFLSAELEKSMGICRNICWKFLHRARKNR